MKIRFPISVPKDWGKEEVEFFCNDSSSCSSNRINEMKKWLEARAERPCDELGNSSGCTCDLTEFRYIGEVEGEGEQGGTDAAVGRVV